MAETSGDYLASLRALIQSEMIDLNTSISAEIVSYSGGFASVRPLAKKRFQDGDSLPFPVIHDVPVRWPVFAGGLAGVRGPIKAGDKCHLVFAQQASDGTDDLRRHDLSDAYALIMDNSQSSQGGNDDDMVLYFGEAHIRLTKTGRIFIKAPDGIQMDTDKDATINAAQKVDIATPITTNNGKLTVTELFTFLGGMSSAGSSGGSSAAITIPIVHTNSYDNNGGAVRSNGKDISSTHKHSGVLSGGAESGPVV